ncbi:PEP-CTERM sorting domain-containing protein [Sphingomonas sp.]|uniref:PEP-CTERM sorting domain-containing protein n=1 Tax=Sphingomonas sp. TaxID=28214 RepID=UPI001B2A1E3C|nr:PEP-CTERM sorting domain-containing protein [Sphingomonas sp.]MBO9712400.1 PEP-CTERM sorting domain-containing protein [Sphingomonas sp.]
MLRAALLIIFACISATSAGATTRISITRTAACTESLGFWGLNELFTGRPFEIWFDIPSHVEADKSYFGGVAKIKIKDVYLIYLPTNGFINTEIDTGLFVYIPLRDVTVDTLDVVYDVELGGVASIYSNVIEGDDDVYGIHPILPPSGAAVSFRRLTSQPHPLHAGTTGLYFSPTQLSISSVPEAYTWAMMLLGMAFIGATLRKRVQHATSTSRRNRARAEALAM